MDIAIRNWAGNVAFGASAFERPLTLVELQESVRRAGKLRVLGSGHSFNHIADTDGTLISLSQMQRIIEIDAEARTVRVDGGATYADLVPHLDAAGLALHNVASLPHITLVGAIATGTHGSGDRNRNLSSSVAAVELVTASGELVTIRRGDAEFNGAVVSLGALGVVSTLTLDLVPAFEIRQNVYLGLKLDTAMTQFDAIMGSAYSVSLFSRWQGDEIDQVWIKALADKAIDQPEFHGATAATGQCHPIPGMNGDDATTQRGIVGPWHERLFHFPIGHKASAGAEVQSEFFVDRKHAPAAIKALHAVQEQFAPALFVGEIRSMAADELWLSMANGRDSIGFHFTWRPEWERTIAAVRVVEEALAPFDARPHWGKVFTQPMNRVQARYDKLDAFRALADRLDPEGKFRNAMVEGLLSSGA